MFLEGSMRKKYIVFQHEPTLPNTHFGGGGGYHPPWRSDSADQLSCRNAAHPLLPMQRVRCTDIYVQARLSISRTSTSSSGPSFKEALAEEQQGPGAEKYWIERAC